MAKEINGYFLRDVTIKGKHFKKGDLVPSCLSPGRRFHQQRQLAVL